MFVFIEFDYVCMFCIFQIKSDMDAIRRDVANLRERYKILQQQQFTFINAMANTRTDAYEKTKPVRSINHVST